MPYRMRQLRCVASIPRRILTCPGTGGDYQCSAGSLYYPAIDECVPTTIASLPVFVTSLGFAHQCNGSTVTTWLQLEALRFCSAIIGDLVITVNDPLADFTALYDITTIQGYFFVLPAPSPQPALPGSLSIINSSVATLSAPLFNLQTISVGGGLTSFNNSKYAVVVAGRLCT